MKWRKKYHRSAVHNSTPRRPGAIDWAHLIATDSSFSLSFRTPIFWALWLRLQSPRFCLGSRFCFLPAGLWAFCPISPGLPLTVRTFVCVADSCLFCIQLVVGSVAEIILRIDMEHSRSACHTPLLSSSFTIFGACRPFSPFCVFWGHRAEDISCPTIPSAGNLFLL